MDMLKRHREVPFFQASKNIFDRKELSSLQKLAYLYFERRADSENKSFPSYQRIADDLSIKRRTAITLVESLIDLGLLVKEQRNKENGSKTSNLYILMPLEVLDEQAILQNNNNQGSDLRSPEVVIYDHQGSDLRSPGVVIYDHPKEIHIEEDPSKNIDDDDDNVREAQSESQDMDMTESTENRILEIQKHFEKITDKKLAKYTAGRMAVACTNNEMIFRAIEKAADAQKPANYVLTILANWKNQKVTSPAQIQYHDMNNALLNGRFLPPRMSGI